MRLWAAIKDNWWLISIKDGPRAGDVLSIGWWLPPASGPVTQEQINSGTPIDCGENTVARMISRDEAVCILAMMQIRAESDDMVTYEGNIR